MMGLKKVVFGLLLAVSCFGFSFSQAQEFSRPGIRDDAPVFRESDAGYIYTKDIVLDNRWAYYLENDYIKKGKRISVFSSALINNYYGRYWFIIKLVLGVLLIKIFLKKKYFVKVGRRKNYEFEYYLLSFMLYGFIVMWVIKATMYGYIILGLGLLYFILTNVHIISETINDIIRERNISIDYGRKRDKEKIDYMVKSLKPDESFSVPIASLRGYGTNQVLIVLWKNILHVWSKFTNYYLIFIMIGVIATFAYLSYIVYYMYTMGLLEFLYKQ